MRRVSTACCAVHRATEHRIWRALVQRKCGCKGHRDDVQTGSMRVSISSFHSENEGPICGLPPASEETAGGTLRRRAAIRAPDHPTLSVPPVNVSLPTINTAATCSVAVVATATVGAVRAEEEEEIEEEIEENEEGVIQADSKLDFLESERGDTLGGFPCPTDEPAARGSFADDNSCGSDEGCGGGGRGRGAYAAGRDGRGVGRVRVAGQQCLAAEPASTHSIEKGRLSGADSKEAVLPLKIDPETRGLSAATAKKINNGINERANGEQNYISAGRPSGKRRQAHKVAGKWQSAGCEARTVPVENGMIMWYRIDLATINTAHSSHQSEWEWPVVVFKNWEVGCHCDSTFRASVGCRFERGP